MECENDEYELTDEEIDLIKTDNIETISLYLNKVVFDRLLDLKAFINHTILDQDEVEVDDKRKLKIIHSSFSELEWLIYEMLSLLGIEIDEDVQNVMNELELIKHLN